MDPQIHDNDVATICDIAEATNICKKSIFFVFVSFFPVLFRHMVANFGLDVALLFALYIDERSILK